MVWHYNKFVQLEAAELAVFIQHVQKQPRQIFLLEQRIAEMRDRRDEERTFLLRGFSQCPPALKRCHSKASLTRP